MSATPFPRVSGIKRTKIKVTYHEWQTDDLDAAASNAQIQGADAATNTAVPTVRLRNYSQILRKVPRVSGTQRVVDSAGRDDEFDYQVSIWHH